MTQCERIYKALEDAKGGWVSGTYFLRTLYLSQFHTRIFELQKKGHNIEASDFTDEHGFKSYRLILSASPKTALGGWEPRKRIDIPQII
jgi:hypothetical protein